MASPQQGIVKGRSSTTRDPVTPSPGSIRPLLHVDSVKGSPDGGIALEPSDGAHTSLTTNDIFTDHGFAQPIRVASKLPGPDDSLSSPTKQANIRVRRANNGSALLQSPARAGHAARMRQIFEDASRDHISPQSGQSVLYPQLPNISRKASPTREYGGDEQHCTLTSPPIRPPESLCLSTSSSRMVQHKLQLKSPHISEQSSESWSDDSGYFIAGSRNRTFSLTGPPRDRINDWLTNVAESECNIPTVKDENECQHSSFSLLLPPPPKLTDIDLLHKSSEQSPTPTCDATIQDPFLDFDTNPRTPSLFKSLPARRFPNTSSSKPLTTQTQAQSTETVTVRSRNSPARQSIFEDGGVQLSPLSPNVCIERGPTRYHSARTSPIKERRAMRYNENRDEDGGIGLAQTEAGVQDSPLAPCKIGAGTRFQHPRHGVRGFGRFGRHLEQ
ncbi:hypothetical protein AA0117_g12496 [Alternaria alternata]|uniref:Uncharacterized protein n=1 Tax=Alternaria alternata TaxID=5599 RepID=A0A4Q4N0B5_ALTAL|nr:hypothetical protein AA0117_g12496 [Alternaria alternata]